MFLLGTSTALSLFESAEISSIVISFLFKLVGAVALWVVGGWLIGLALRLMRQSLNKGTLDPTVVRYLLNILGVILRVILIVAILGFLRAGDAADFAATSPRLRTHCCCS